MNGRTILLIFPVLIGIMAGVAGLLQASGISIEDLFGRSELFFGSLGAGLLVLSRKIWKGLAPSSGAPIKPKAIGARFVDGIGEISFEAGHSRDISDLPNVPLNCRIVTVRVNQQYRVEIPARDRATAERIARSLGYTGKVG